MNRNGLILIMILIATAAMLNVLPTVEHGRTAIPEGISFGKNCGCDCISRARPWFGTLNYWLWLWIIAIPVFVFSLKISCAGWKKTALFILAFLLATLACYAAINLSVSLQWDIWNGPFLERAFATIEGEDSCVNIGDGGSLAFALLFGWIPAGLYTAFWMLVRYGGAALLRKIRRP